jgi:hypothetical protein
LSRMKFEILRKACNVIGCSIGMEWGDMVYLEYPRSVIFVGLIFKCLVNLMDKK